MLEPTLNSTCEWHPQFAAPTRYRFCSCYDQRPIARQLAETLKGLSARCVGAGNSDDDDDADFFSFSLWSIFDFFTTSTKSLLDYMLPLAYDRHAETLLLLKFTPRKVNWLYEIFNPRFYGLPFSIAVHTEKFSFTPDELVIKGLDLHFGVLVKFPWYFCNLLANIIFKFF